MATTTTTKKYEVTLELKSVPTEVREEITAKVIKDFDTFTEKFAMPEHVEHRLANRDLHINNKIENEIWSWKYDRKTIETIFADNKADATKQARELAKQLGLKLIYVYYISEKKGA
jgi:hypothetical protein